jgi:adenosylmethionine-8-amino-7-oxononanoate aminotransferase
MWSKLTAPMSGITLYSTSLLKPMTLGLLSKGKGIKVWDQNGKEHVDGVSGGVWTVNVGYGRESIA